TVGIPRVISRNPAEHIEWIPLLAEVRSNPADPASGPFSFSSPGVQKGVVAAMLNYPFQSAALSGFRESAGPGNIGNQIPADDSDVTVQGSPPANTDPANPDYPSGVAPYSGPYGLGSQYAFAGETV